MIKRQIPPILSNFTQQLEKIVGFRCQVEEISPTVFLVNIKQHSTILVFYLLILHRKHWTPPDSLKATRIIHLDEDLCQNKNKQINHRLSALFGKGQKISARQTVAARISKKMAMEFQQDYHLHVPLPGKYRYGLFTNGELVSVAVFSGGRRMNDKSDNYRSFELLRFCHRADLLIVGGLSKLIVHFSRDFAPGDIMTYLDKTWSDGSSYKATGFIPISSTQPQQFWVDCNTWTRYSQHTLPQDVEACDEDERIARGYYPIENLGSLKMVRY
ncbi:hypothetical protein SAMN05216436_12055 [bacterium A37T11]|nr:hypothetical protein SAMN05216436_12055 [bacterium A37T11]